MVLQPVAPSLNLKALDRAAGRVKVAAGAVVDVAAAVAQPTLRWVVSARPRME